MNKEMRYEAKNGLPVYTMYADGSHSFAISLFLKGGTISDSEGECGLCHLLEHLLIRNANYLMGGGLYPLLDRYGIELGASTYTEFVQISLVGSPKNLSIAIEVLKTLFMPISLPRAEFIAERDRVKSEIREVVDKSSLSSFTAECVWGDSSLSRPITGTAGDLSRYSVRRVEEYRHGLFTPENAFVYVTGNFSENDITELVDSVGRCRLYQSRIAENLAPVPNNFGKRGLSVHIKNADFTKVRFSFDYDTTSISIPECDLLYDTLLGGYASRLFVELSEKRGLCYDLVGSIERYRNVGVFSFSYEVRGKALYDSLEVVVDVLTQIKTHTLLPEGCMKAGYTDNCEMLLDDPRELGFTFAYDNHIMSESYSSLCERRQAYESVTPERLSRVAQTMFTTDNLTFSAKAKRKSTDEGRIREILMKLEGEN